MQPHAADFFLFVARSTLGFLVVDFPCFFAAYVLHRQKNFLVFAFTEAVKRFQNTQFRYQKMFENCYNQSFEQQTAKDRF